MIDAQYPILEFDRDKHAFIRPHQLIQPLDVPEHCVLCFFREAIAGLLDEVPHQEVARLQSESMDFPVYVLTYKGRSIAVTQAAVGAPVAAAQIDELTAMGFCKFVVCGSCGVLRKDLAVGHVIVPDSAVRDEGTSYHYLEPSREVEADPVAVKAIEEALRANDVPYLPAKTWTTDAFYRETPAKIKKRKAEGCVTVEMESSAYMAVARYNGVRLGQLLYAGDNLGGEAWDSREFQKHADVRAFLLRITLDACLNL